MGDKQEIKFQEQSLRISDKRYLICEGKLGKVSKQVGGEEVVLGYNKVLLRSKSSYKVFRSLLLSMLNGVNKGYFKELEFVGLGFRFLNLKKGLYLKIGFSHYIKLRLPKSIKIIGFKTKLIIFGINLEEVNQVAREIKALKKPDRYKGKGIRYESEEVILKVGKQS